jgi:hypothetical protein
MIELAKDDEDPTFSLGSLSLTLEEEYSSEVWEKIEDAVADALAQLNIKGYIDNSVTGNSVTIQRKEDQ